MSTVLADTSVWRRHFSGGKGVAHLSELLDEGSLVIHPWIIGELVLGGVSARAKTLLQRLPRASVVPDEEVLAFVHSRKLQQRGVGWVDVHLLASALVQRSALWTLDQDLAAAAAHCGAGYEPA